MKISRYNLRFQLQLFWQYFKQKFSRRKFKPVESLDLDILKKVEAEASFLREHHGVEVHRLAEGEMPELPKPAKPTDY